MRIAPTSALSRLATRFNERRARAAAGERPPMTDTDEQNLRTFAQVVVELTQLLGRENDALRSRDTHGVAQLFEHKQELLKRLETRQPVVEPFLRESAEVSEQLRGHIRTLAAALETNGALLEVMSEAARGIRTEVTRVRERHSLKGMYDKSGASIETGPLRQRGIDTNY